LSWERRCGPFFGNEIAMLVIDGRRCDLLLERSARLDDPAELIEVARIRLAG
jgi:hypothetical protein